MDIGNIAGTVSKVETITGSISPIYQGIGATFSEAQLDTSERYEGDYEIEPRAEPQVFETRAKKMADDLTVAAIPYYETSNEHGTTVIIGG